MRSLASARFRSGGWSAGSIVGCTAVVWLAAVLPAALAQSGAPAPDDTDAAQLQARYAAQMRALREVWPTRPHRRERALRTINLTDEEIRQIEAATRTLHPEALVNIGAVTTDCACQNGPDCTAEVWVVAYGAAASTGLMLARISDVWQIGPLQQWWMDYEGLFFQPSGDRAGDLQARVAAQQALLDRYPSCAASAADG